MGAEQRYGRVGGRRARRGHDPDVRPPLFQKPLISLRSCQLRAAGLFSGSWNCSEVLPTAGEQKSSKEHREVITTLFHHKDKIPEEDEKIQPNPAGSIASNVPRSQPFTDLLSFVLFIF